jgi:hypothetical protein
LHSISRRYIELNLLANICETWVKRIKEFKNNCSKKFLNKIESDLQESLRQAQDPYALDNKINSLQNKVFDDERLKNQEKEKALEMQFEEFKRQARDILTKEDEYEAKLEQQQREHYEIEQRKLRESSEREEQTARRLLDDMQNIVQQDNSYKIKETMIKNEMKNMMKEINDRVQQKRERLVYRLNNLKMRNDQALQQVANRMISLKREYGQKIFRQTPKQRNPSQCMTKNPTMIQNYCSQNITDYKILEGCKRADQFCYICCLTEIGGQNDNDVNCCVSRCENVQTNSSNCFGYSKSNYMVNTTQGVIIN